MKIGPFLKGLMFILIAGILFGPSTGWAQTPETQFFPGTGHSVRGKFLQFFKEHGGLDIFGPPISEELMEDGVRVQYFQNVRLEVHPENPRPYRVQPGLLGDLIGVFQPPISPADIPAAGLPDQRYYPQTGHTLKHGFLAFFDYYGGVDIFGYPISEIITEPDGRIVQWFQRAQLEWCPNDAGGRIQLASLGQNIFEGKYQNTVSEDDPESVEDTKMQAFGVQPGVQTKEPPAAPSAMNSTMPDMLKMTASVRNAVTGGPNPGSQQVSVFVTDEMDVGVPAIVVELTVSSPAGEEKLVMPATDEAGFTTLSFEIGQVEPGVKVVVSAQTALGDQKVTTETSFLPWY